MYGDDLDTGEGAIEKEEDEEEQGVDTVVVVVVGVVGVGFLLSLARSLLPSS